MYGSRFWTKNYDEGVGDLPDATWETTYTKSIRRSFEDYPREIAYEFLGVECTYGELETRSNQFANTLADHGFTKGDIVALSLPNTPQFVISFVGALKAGCVISGLSPLLTEEQMKYQLNDLGSGEKKICLVTLDIIFEKRFTKIASEVPRVKLVLVSNIACFLPRIKQVLGKALKRIPSGVVTPVAGTTVRQFKEVFKSALKGIPRASADITPDDVALIMYTGGTTGSSKGAVITHRNLVADMLLVSHWIKWKPAGGNAVCGLPFFHLGGLCFLIQAIYLGWALPLIPDPRNVKHICELVKKYKPKALLNVPALFQMLLNYPKFKELDLSCIDNCFSGAAPFPIESQEALEATVGKGKLIELYGMTELSPVVTMTPMRGKKKLGTVGMPLPNEDLKIVDPETGKEVPIGEAGEICARGPMVMQGYYNKPDETAHAIDADGYMHTGDVGIMDDEGYVRIIDRTKDMISVGGYKVFSAKVESVLSKHPAVDLIALVGVPNPERPGSEHVKAFLQVRPDSPLKNDPTALKENIEKYAREHCASYEVPKFIEIIDQMPLTLVGKVDKKTLRARVKKEV
nr:AMP-binding protein [Candidatus Sigynarchaeota archaeon]